jgi:ADP-ribose pyrophosphatase YjhB (NUDIX family)
LTDLKQALYLIADEMRGMASMTKAYANNIYDSDRAERMMELAARIAALTDNQNPQVVHEIFEHEPWLRYSPAIGVDAAVFNDKQELLLIQRRDNERWVMPGGVAEIGQTLSEAVLRELWEEAGLRGQVTQLLGVFDGRLWQTRSKVHLIHVVFQVSCIELTPNIGTEAIDAGFFPVDQLPITIDQGHAQRIPHCIAALRGTPFFDPADSTLVKMSAHQRPDR